MKPLYKITKQVAQQLFEISCMLPPVPIATKTKATGREILTEPQYKDLPKDNICENKMYTVTSGGSPQAVNHLKRLRSAWMQGGNAGVDQYLKPYMKKSA